jgi:predicted aldo/keto reductase-like oxidoreductase
MKKNDANHMQYRKFGRLDWKVSALGFGCMRFPTTDGNPLSGKVDEAESIRMIRHSIDQGVNYVDTAYPYHNGASEVILGKALQEGFREKVRIATKSPVWLVEKADDFDRYLNEQLGRLGTDYVDYYLFHGLGKKRWEDTVLKLNLLERADSALKDGRVKHIGFSFHDGYDAFKTIVDGYDKWSFCQIQYNYMDTENQAGTKGLKYAASKGLAVVVMEPLLGGRLANPPKAILEILKDSGDVKGPVDLALQWIWDQPEVSVILSGMSTMGQVKSNLRSASRSRVGSMKPAEHELIQRVKDKYRSMIPIPCTGCGYCMPCPNGVDIPGNFELFNNGSIHEDMHASRITYSRFMAEKERASSCIQCKTCEEKCPQKILVSELMPNVHKALGEEQKK